MVLYSICIYAPRSTRSTKDKLLVYHIDTLTKIDVKIDKCELPIFYWLPKLHKSPYKPSFVSNSSHYSTTFLSKLITSTLTAVKYRVIKYNETAFSNGNVNHFGSIKTLLNSSRTRLCNFQGSHISHILLHTHHCHMILSKQVLSLVK